MNVSDCTVLQHAIETFADEVLGELHQVKRQLTVKRNKDILRKPCEVVILPNPY